jgi:crotonobetainyl-CoA:carnitine CoA-transferase CaiB-like acyl-CoA transferase
VRPDTTEARPPLDGLTVLDLGQIYQGPYAGFLLARAGARVIKIEPLGGEPLRRHEIAGQEHSYPLALLNSNKLGMALDLKAPRGKALLLRMVEKADVLIENFAPGTLERLGLAATLLLERNPRLVYASGSGYGLSGPDRDLLALDHTVQAASGLMSITGFADGPPLRTGPAITDFLGGSHLYAAIVTALLERERTGRGRVVEVALQDTAIPALCTDLGLLYRAGGKLPPRRGNRHGGVAPYNVYQLADGWMAIICINDIHWLNLARAMGREELANDERFATNAARVAAMDEVDAVVAAWASGTTRRDIDRLAREHRIPMAPVRDLLEVLDDPHLHARGTLVRIDHPDLGPIVLIESPLRFHGTPASPIATSPKLGQHTRTLLIDWLGIPPAEVNDLEKAKIVVATAGRTAGTAT